MHEKKLVIQKKFLPKFLFLGILLIILILLAGCINLNLFQPEQGVINLRVFDGFGVPLNEVKVFNKTELLGKTNNEGYFNYKFPATKRLLLNFKKEGKITFFKIFEITPNKTTFYSIKLDSKAEPVLINSLEGGSIGLQGKRIEIPANSLFFENGKKVEGNVEVSVNFFDPTKPQDLESFPGDFSGIDSQNKEQLIESFGFVNIEVEKEKQKVNLKENQAILEIPISEDANAPQETGLWFFDEEKGTWVETGTLEKKCVNSKCFYSGKISHFSTWNADKSYEVLTVHGLIFKSSMIKEALFVTLGLAFPQYRIGLFAFKVGYDVIFSGKSFSKAITDNVLSFVGGNIARQFGLGDAYNLGKVQYAIFKDVSKIQTRILMETFQSDPNNWTSSNIEEKIYNGMIERYNQPFKTDEELDIRLPPKMDTPIEGDFITDLTYNVNKLPEPREVRLDVDKPLLREAIRETTPSLMDLITRKTGKQPGSKLTEKEIEKINQEMPDEVFHATVTRVVLGLPEKEAEKTFINKSGKPQKIEEILVELTKASLNAAKLFKEGNISPIENASVKANGLDYSSQTRSNSNKSGEYTIATKKNSKVEIQAFVPGLAVTPLEIKTDNRNVRPTDNSESFQRILPILLTKPDKKAVIVLDVSGSMEWPIGFPNDFNYEDKNVQQILFDFNAEKNRDEYTEELLKYLKEKNIDKSEYIRIDAAKKALLSSIDLFKENNYAVSFITFSSSAKIEMPLTFEYNKLKEKIENLSISGGTDIEGAISEALNVLGENGIIIFITDGEDPDSKKRIMQKIDEYNVVEIAKNKNVRICTIGIGFPTTVDSELLSYIANKASCNYKFGENLSKIKSSILENIYTETGIIFITETNKLKSNEKQVITKFNAGNETNKLKIYLVSNGSPEIALIDKSGNESKKQAEEDTPLIIEIDKPTVNQEYSVEVRNNSEKELNFTITISSEGQALQPI